MRVAVLKVLKDGATEGVFALLRELREELAVALHDEARQAAFEIGFGVPGECVPQEKQGINKIPRRNVVGERFSI